MQFFSSGKVSVNHISRRVASHIEILKNFCQNDDNIIKRVIWGVRQPITKAESNKLNYKAVNKTRSLGPK
jgi:hypothetical protein